MQSSTPPRGRSWASGDDTWFISLIVIMVALGIFAYMGWTRNHVEVSRAFAQLAHWHIQFIQLVTDEYDSLDRQLLTADYSRVTLKSMLAVATTIGLWYRIPVAVLLGTLGVVCFFRSPGGRYRRKLDLDGLITEQAKTFRTIAAFAARGLRLRELRPGDPRPADPALHGREWLACYAVRNGKLNETALRAELTRQLGSVWVGAEKAPSHVRVLFAAFALHGQQRRLEALALLGDLSEDLRPRAPEDATGPEVSLAVTGPIVARADALLASGLGIEWAAQAARHAHTTPAMMTVLLEARRRGGVLPPAAFNCIKLVDRRFWYALHSLGFPSEAHGRTHHPNPNSEAIGARDHWAFECSVGRPIMKPAIDRAVAALVVCHEQTQRNRRPGDDAFAEPSSGPQGPTGPSKQGAHA